MLFYSYSVVFSFCRIYLTEHSVPCFTLRNVKDTLILHDTVIRSARETILTSIFLYLVSSSMTSIFCVEYRLPSCVFIKNVVL